MAELPFANGRTAIYEQQLAGACGVGEEALWRSRFWLLRTVALN